MKNAGSTKKSGGFANKKRKRLSLTQFPVVDEAWLQFFFAEKSPCSRKLMQRQAQLIARDLGFLNLKL